MDILLIILILISIKIIIFVIGFHYKLPTTYIQLNNHNLIPDCQNLDI